MKSCGGLFVASLFWCLAFAPAAHATSGIKLAQATSTQPAPADQPAANATQTPDNEPAGNVATLKGTATVTRNGTTTPLKVQDDIYKGDELQTGKNSSLGVTFTDDTTLNLSASSRVVIDNFIYHGDAKDNAALINVTKGTMAFVAAAVAKTGDMKIETPTATLGIRGTTGVVEVPEGSATNTANNVGVKLYPDADGKVGRIEVKGRDGAPLGMLTQAASGFTVRGVMVSGFGMRMSALPMIMSPQMIARDRGFVQRVHTMQGIGRNIVMQQRNFRLQNPGQRGGFNQPGQRGGLNQPALRNPPGVRTQPGRQPALPNQRIPNSLGQPGRSGLPSQPGLQRAPGTPNQLGPRSGQHPRPMQQRPAVTPGPSGYQRPAGIPGAPALQGPAGIINRAGVNRFGIPNRVGGQQLPPALRPGQRPAPASGKPVQLPKQKLPLPNDGR